MEDGDNILLKTIKKFIVRLFGLVIVNKYNYDEQLLKTFDNKIKNIFLNLIEKEKVIIFDVGANLGHSIERYLDIFPKASIHSFEPNIKLFNRLKKIYNKNNIFLNPFGLSNSDSKANLHIASNSNMSSIETINYNSKFFKIRKIKSENTVEVDLTTIDNYCSINSINRIDILKLNIQGHEPKCLEGGLSLIKNNKIDFMVIEVDMGDRYGVTHQLFDIEKHIVPYGYTLFDIILIKRNSLGKICMLNIIYSSSKIISISD